MNYTELSDLEEGEILEYETVSTSYPGSNLGVRNWPPESSVQENKNGDYGFTQNTDLYLTEQGKHGYINTRLKEKLNLNDRQGENKSIISMTDLESISSEGEYKSDEEEKCSAGESEYYRCRNGEAKKGKKHSSHFYGAVEDIMSEIGETICRKSRNYKKRKSKESKLDLDKASNSNYDLWRREIFYSHLKSRKHKRKGSFCDADTDLGKYRTEKKKKRKRRDDYCEEEETAAKKLKLRDFDEMRRNLLEKLKKQKAEEESKEPASETHVEVENSEIQEIDMLIDCTNYVDNPPDAFPNSSGEGRGQEEKEGEDELDLVKLRLIALASNKKRKAEESTSTLEKAEDSVSEKKPDCGRPEMDLDRNELQLRAEALKTALLKKHQRRLNRLKLGKPTETSSSSIKQVANSATSPAEDDEKREHLEAENVKLDPNASKGNVERERNECSIAEVVPLAHVNVDESKPNDVTFPPSANSKKTISRGKSKRRKRKSVSFANNLKENNEKSEALDEDDDTLRTQLLSDLMRKKSLKDQARKSVLMDSIQTAANKPSPSVANTEPPKSTKPLPEIKNNWLKKINMPKVIKPAVAPKFPKPEIQRIIVHLGSEDSSDEEGGCPQPPAQEEIESKGNAVAEPPGESQEIGEGTQAKYERSVELLLSQARRKIEGEKRIAMSTLSTPEAVYKHLPPSQRLEYIRLKQKIAERENLRKQKKENPGNSVLPSSGVQPSSEESLKSVPSNTKFGIVAKTDSEPLNSLPAHTSSHKSVSESFKAGVVRPSSTAPKTVGGFTAPNGGKTNAGRRLVVNRLINRLSQLPGRGSNAAAVPPRNGPEIVVAAQRNVLLLPSSQALLSKLKLLLKKIKIEKTIEENYETEISKLKNQLSLFEKKKCEQRFKIKKLWEESMKTYKAIQGITAKTKGKAVPKECEGDEEAKREKKEGSTDERKVENEAAQEADGDEGKKVSDETETETEISKAQTKSDKELHSDDKISETVSDDTSSGPCLIKYDSPLQVFSQVSDLSTRVDPNVMVCQFDLMGVCKDEECTYQHLRILAK